MNNELNILLSIEDRHVQKLLEGTKKVELRRRKIEIPKGSVVWIYSKVPAGKICAYGIVDYISYEKPNALWTKYGDITGISIDEFNTYFDNRDLGCGIIFEKVIPLDKAVTLDYMRSKLKTFHPPQFFKYLSFDSPELEIFKGELKTA